MLEGPVCTQLTLSGRQEPRRGALAVPQPSSKPISANISADPLATPKERDQGQVGKLRLGVSGRAQATQ